MQAHENLTFEKVWASIMDLRESQKETDRQMKETDRQMKETDRQMKETDRKIGELGNRFGELAEHLVAPGIMDKFNERGFNFTRCSNDVIIKEPGNPNAIAEVDIMLENGETVIAVEVKAKAKQADIDKHIKRMELLRRIADQRMDTRKYQGAVAVAILSQEMRDSILQNGFYTIEQTGDTVKLTNPEGFIPREW
jgi:hypothetical protein